MSAQVLQPEDHSSWDRWLKTSPTADLRQASGYGRALELFGHRPEVLITRDGAELTAGALLGVRKMFPFAGPAVHTSGGVALRDPSDSSTFNSFLEALLNRCEALGASTVDVFVRVPRAIDRTERPAGAALEAELRGAGFRLREPFDTYYVGLEHRSENELLQSFGKNQRRDIRKALREGVTVEPSVAVEDFADFEAAHHAMSRQKQLVPLPGGLLSGILHSLASEGFGELFVARHRGVSRNYILVSSVGAPTYLWGATAEAARERGCPPTGQVLQHSAMCRAMGRGCEFYDLGGTPGIDPDPSHPNYPVWRFKAGFGGSYVNLLGWWRRTLRPVDAGLLDLLRRGASVKRRLFGR